MSYIRYNDEIYMVANMQYGGFGTSDQGNGYYYYRTRSDISGVSHDKIQDHRLDLEFLFQAIIVVKANERTVYKLRDFNKTSHKLLREDIKNGIKKVYGAIWVKGEYVEVLKPVAEMQEDGKWKLFTFAKHKVFNQEKKEWEWVI